MTSIRGVSVVGAAAILAETGDPARFDDAKAVVKHAGLSPATTPLVGLRAGPPSRVGVGRCCGWPPGGPWGALPHNPAFAARYSYLTSRQRNRLSDGQARTAVAAALLPQLRVVCVNRIPWELAVASGTTGKEVTDPAA